MTGRARLTRSELHVARLAASGLSNAAIAEVRGTSVRTVANQIAHILSELGVASRRSLALRMDFSSEGRTIGEVEWSALTRREQEVVARACYVTSQKALAMDLGIAQSSVSRILISARSKLGLACVGELLRAWVSRAATGLVA